MTNECYFLMILLSKNSQLLKRVIAQIKKNEMTFFQTKKISNSPNVKQYSFIR